MENPKLVGGLSVGALILSLGALFTFNSQLDNWLKGELQPMEQAHEMTIMELNRRIDRLEENLNNLDDKVSNLRRDMNANREHASERRNTIENLVIERFEAFRGEEMDVMERLAQIEEAIEWLERDR